MPRCRGRAAGTCSPPPSCRGAGDGEYAAERILLAVVACLLASAHPLPIKLDIPLISHQRSSLGIAAQISHFSPSGTGYRVFAPNLTRGGDLNCQHGFLALIAF